MSRPQSPMSWNSLLEQHRSLQEEANRQAEMVHQAIAAAQAVPRAAVTVEPWAQTYSRVMEALRAELAQAPSGEMATPGLATGTFGGALRELYQDRVDGDFTFQRHPVRIGQRNPTCMALRGRECNYPLGIEPAKCRNCLNLLPIPGQLVLDVDGDDEWENCTDCDGEGSVTNDDDEDGECSTCEGSGRVEVDRDEDDDNERTRIVYNGYTSTPIRFDEASLDGQWSVTHNTSPGEEISLSYGVVRDASSPAGIQFTSGTVLDEETINQARRFLAQQNEPGTMW